MKTNLIGVAVVCLLSAAVPAHAQDNAQGASKRPAAANAFQKMVEPSFRVLPIVHRLQGRRGESIPFTYTVESTGKELQIELQIVGLRQEESGIILYDDLNPAADAIRLSTPLRLTVAPGKTETIRGELTIPLEKAKFHSFGILAKDLGQVSPLDAKFDAQGRRVTQAGIRFVTQYVLRCDVDVLNAGGDRLSEVVVEGGQLVNIEGNPVARAYVRNPTNSAFELQVRAGMPTPDGEGTKAFFLGMPSRADLDPSDRYLIRLMPHSRVRIEAPVKQSLLPGTQDMELDLLAGTRRVNTNAFSVAVNPGDFPALQVAVARVGENLTVVPSCVELSQLKKGKRNLTLLVRNLTDTPQDASLNATSLGGEQLEDVIVSPREFTLPANGSRRIQVTLRSSQTATEPMNGYLRIVAQSATRATQIASLPMLLLYGPRETANVQLSAMQWRSDDTHPTVAVKATNRGRCFVPVLGKLEIADELGQSMNLTAGYGRWLHPGEGYDLEFKLSALPPAGLYQLRLNVFANPGDDPITTTTTIRIGMPADDSGSAAISDD